MKEGPGKGVSCAERWETENQAGLGQLKTFVLKAAAVSWGNSRENTR